MAELLSICIPTYNRSEYLSELLESIGREIEQEPELAHKIQIYISDNASTDSTWQVCQQFHRKHNILDYSRNERNIGGDRNIIKCCTLGSGKYRWVVGDDELIASGGLVHIIKTLESQKPGLFINNDGRYRAKLSLPGKYQDFREFANAAIKAGNPHVLIAHTLITANVFLSTCFDRAIAEYMLPNTQYAHMYGLVAGLVKTGGSVYVTEYKTIHVREQRAGEYRVGDKEESRLIINLEKYWAEYIEWIRDFVNVPKLEVDKALRYPFDSKTKCARFILYFEMRLARFVPSKVKAFMRQIYPFRMIIQFIERRASG